MPVLNTQIISPHSIELGASLSNICRSPSQWFPPRGPFPPGSFAVTLPGWGRLGAGLRAPFAWQIVTAPRGTRGPEPSSALLVTSSQSPLFILQPAGSRCLPLGSCSPDAQCGREWPELVFPA